MSSPTAELNRQGTTQPGLTYSAEAEVSVLGGMLLDAEAIPLAREIVDDTMFYREANRRLFRSMIRIWKRGEVIDAVTLTHELQNTGDFEAVGGLAYLAEIWDAVPTAANIEHHARIVREKAARRRLIAGGAGITAMAADGKLSISDVLTSSEQLLGGIRDAAAVTEQAGKRRSLLCTVADVLNDPDAMREPEAVIPRLAYAGRLTLLSAREKEGKSTLASAGASAVSDGARFLGEMGKAGPVLWVGLEEHRGDTARRFQSFGAQPARVFLLEALEAPLADLAAAVEQSGAVLVVVDTLSRFAETLVKDAGSSTDWTPVMAGLTRLARDTNAAVLLLHHARKDGGYRDSTAIGAGVDALFEMTAGEDGTTRRIKGRGRWAVEDFSVRLEGGRYELTGGELTLDARVLLFIENNPSCSMRALREGVTGKTETIAAAVRNLIKTGAVEDRGEHASMRLFAISREPLQEPAPDATGSREKPREPREEPLSGTANEGDRFPVFIPKGGRSGTTPRRSGFGGADLEAEIEAEEEAVRALLEDLLAGGDLEVGEVEKQARKSGVSERPLYRAKHKLGVLSEKQTGGRGGWIWRLPTPPRSDSGKVGNVSADVAGVDDSEDPQGCQSAELEGRKFSLRDLVEVDAAETEDVE